LPVAGRPDSFESDGPIAVVLKGYPRLSETFIAQELRALEQRGLHLHLFSLRLPTDTKRHPIHDEIKAPVTYLPEYLHQHPGTVFGAWRRARRLPGYREAWRLWRKDLRRDRTRNRIRRFGQAMVLASSLPPGTRHIYAHFLHTPASVARYAAAMTGLPWSVSAHAKDIWTSPEWEKREKLDDMAWLTTCTQYAADHLRALSTKPVKVNLIYHGIDLERFSEFTPAPASCDGLSSDAPVKILSVGRAVKKKGFDILLLALAELPKERAWRWQHIGGGPELKSLHVQAEELGLTDRIDWRGPQAQDEVLAAYRESDLFVLPSLISDDGDRDGLPNVLMEAQSQGLCCISTSISGIPELIDHLKTGLLVKPNNSKALSDAILQLISDPDRRQQYGSSGQKRVREVFDASVTVGRLYELLSVGS